VLLFPVCSWSGGFAVCSTDQGGGKRQSVSGIDAIAADLKKKGVEFTREPTTVCPGVRICFPGGPEGVTIELLDRDSKYSSV